MQRRLLLQALALPAWAITGCGGGGDAPVTPTAPDTVTGIATLAVSDHAAVTAADGSVIVIGGSRGLSSLSEGVDRIDPASGRITRLGALSSGMAGHRAVLLADGRILVAGGQRALLDGPRTELIDPVSGRVSDAGRLVQARSGHSLTHLGGGRVLLVGGVGRDSAELWDPASGSWRLLPSRLRHVRAFHSATLLADGQVLIVGGDAGGAAASVFAELWSPQTEAFTPLDTGISEARLLHAAWRMADGSVAIVGGEVLRDAETVPLASTWRYLPDTRRFVAARKLDQARTLAVAVGDVGGRLLLVGGQTASEVAVGRTSTWSADDGERTRWALPSPRIWHTANRLPDGRVLVVGGEDGRGQFAQTVLLLA